MGEAHLLLWIHAHRTPFLDRLFLFSRFLGETWVLGLVVLATAAALAWARQHRASLTWLAAGLATLILGGGIKLAVGRARPHLWPWLVPPHGYSFPSGHALGTSVVFTLLASTFAIFAPRVRRVAFGCAAVLILYVGFGRLYLGVHWPGDVFAGWALGLTIAGVARRHLLPRNPAREI